MTTQTTRNLISQLADDLGWLEQHCRQQANQEQAAAHLRLATALTRNCIGPLLDDQSPIPLHIAVVGGAGAGKSTVANLLSGASNAAEANPQAGFTRHPVAYTSANGPLSWTGHYNFLGPLRRLEQAGPSSLDQDVYQVRRVPVDPTSFDLLKDFIVWDCPDMTTWAAGGYVSRLIEVSALADVIVYVASDERYNDEIPTQFLRLLLQAGKPVVVCLTKMREGDAQTLVDHFKKEVLSQMPAGVVGVLAIPYLSPAQLADTTALVARYRIPLLNQVAVLGGNPNYARRRTVQGATNFLVRTHEQMLAIARLDLAALEQWQNLVQQGQREFDRRYQKEYLETEKFRGFDEALVRMIELLELPGVGRVVSGALYLVRTPYRLLSSWLGKAMTRPEAAARPEEAVLNDSRDAWIDQLRKEAAQRNGTHPLWTHLAQNFLNGGLTELTRERFQQGLKTFQGGQSSEVNHTARAIYEELEKSPGLLNSLRGSKFALDAVAIGAMVATMGWAHVWFDFIMVPLAASVTQWLVEFMGQQYVDSQREQTRRRMQLLMVQSLSAPLAEWLTRWPATGGSSFERLQLTLRRIPDNVRQIDGLLRAKPVAA
jgi:50S ribosome-binding GTPase